MRRNLVTRHDIAVQHFTGSRTRAGYLACTEALDCYAPRLVLLFSSCRSVTTYAILSLAALVCALLYVALGFGAWGRRAAPAERDELDDLETEHCCNRSRAASNAACGAG